MAEDRMLSDEELLALIKKNSGGGGTTNYNQLENKPQIAGTELQGNKSLADLGIASAQSVLNITNGESINNFAGVETALDDVETTLATKQNATDNSLETDAKTIVGAINEHEGDIGSLKSGLTNLDNEVNGDATTYPYADVITIGDAVPANVADCNVKVEPVQDLHGYDKPWVGGAGKNKLPMTVDGIKAANSGVTWTGNSTTINGVTFTIHTDDADNVVWISVSGTASGNSDLILNDYLTYSAASYNINGCPASGSEGTYCLIVGTSTTRLATDTGLSSGFTLTEETSLRSAIRIFSGYTASNLTFYPMIRLATETDATFAPYTNICPISGHTEVDVQRDGKNLGFFNSFEEKTTEGVKFTYINPTLIHIKRTAQSANTAFLYSSLDDLKRITLNAGTYRVSCNLPSGAYNGFMRLFKYVDGNFVVFMDTIRDGGYHVFTLTERSEFVMQVQITSVQSEIDMDVWMQIELGSTTTTYEPYAGKTYTLALGDTIYGGTVDFETGVMVVTHKYVDMGTLGWFKDSTNVFKATLSDGKYGVNLLCSQYYATTNVNVDGTIFFNNAYYGDNKMAVCDSRYADDTAETFKTAMDGVQLVYELATPTTIQLTPQQIQLLKGQNTLTASTGDISVTVNGVSGSIGSVQEKVNGLAQHIGWNERRNLCGSIEQGTIDQSGHPSSNSVRCRTVDYIAVDCNSMYVCSVSAVTSGKSTRYAAVMYDATHNKCGDSGWEESGTPITTTSDTKYVRLVFKYADDSIVTPSSFDSIQFEKGTQTSEYVPYYSTVANALNCLLPKVPDAPSTDGTYSLQVTVASGTPTYSWVSTT